MEKQPVSFEEIEQFLQGRDPQEYIVAIEAPSYKNEVYLVINHPEKGKFIETHVYKPFMWVKHGLADYMFNGSRSTLKKKMKEHGVSFKSLNVSNDKGEVPKRMEEGFKYLAECNKSYKDLIQFFSEGGLDVYSQEKIPNTDIEQRSLFFTLTPTEQFLIQSGKRLFKGIDDYSDLHRLQFDLETEGLSASTDPIFQIGIRDNRGFEEVLEVKGNTPQEKRDSERVQICRFFEIIDELKPDIITAYNSENFDWPYFERRCERLGIDISDIAITLNSRSKFRRKPSKLKLGSDSEPFEQTLMWGYNILDISHTVRKAMAINSDIKSWSLKWITKFSNVAKKNRVYVDGDKIHTTWADKQHDYAFNDETGDWYKITEENPLKGGYEIKKGDYIIQRYLLDDLWETEEVDGIYNQAAYLVAKLLPTSYMRSSTMGTAGQWKLIMAAWSYERGLGVPALEKKRDFTGGLSRLLEVGFARDVDKFDFAALYPKTQLTWDIFPALDISGVMKGLLTYIVDTRDEFKFKTGKHKSRYKELQKVLDTRDDLTPDVINKTKKAIVKHKRLASNFDKKQLPLKILANSFFGAYGAPYLFNWGDSDCAEETTCRGRQSLRLMVKFFKDRGFRPLVGDTDGFNFARPKNINEYTYMVKGNHWKTEGKNGVELKGIDAVLAEFNETHMIGRMGLDLDDVCSSTINFSRKNYANAIDGKIKLVGNTIKSNKMPIYIEEFLDKGIQLLLDGKGHEFINLYYDYVEKIYNYQIPLVKIASKGKVKKSVEAYKKHIQGKNKAGNNNPRQAHMELIIKHNLNVSLGDIIYYVNTGTAKSHGDLKTIKDKEGGKDTIELMCKLIPRDQIENNPNLTTDEYNVAKYLDAFNKRIKPLLVCFSPEIREREEVIKSGKNKGQTKIVDNILSSLKKNTKTKQLELEPRKEFTEKQCELVAGHPYEKGDQDSYDDLMTMEDKEIRFWTSVNKLPNFMDADEWEKIIEDYHERMKQVRIDGIQAEKDILDSIFTKLELKDLNTVEVYGKLPNKIDAMVNIVQIDGVHVLWSKKWDVELCNFNDIWRYEDRIKERHQYYQENGLLGDKKRYEKWETWVNEREFKEGSDDLSYSASSTISIFDDEKEEKCYSVEDSETPDINESEAEFIKYQEERLNTKVGLPPDHQNDCDGCEHCEKLK